MWITRTSINQPVFATMVMLALVVLGLFSYRLLPVEQMPEISMPQAYITVEYPGASPEAIEDDVIKPIENVVNSVDGVHNIYATAREGSAIFQIDFRLETDVIAATQEVRDKVAQIRSTLPREVREPTIERASNDSQQGAVVELVVYSTRAACAKSRRWSSSRSSSACRIPTASAISRSAARWSGRCRCSCGRSSCRACASASTR